MADDRPSRFKARHRPVMVREVLRWLALEPGQNIVDGTIGGGGHASAILSGILPGGRLIGLDRDPMMLTRAATTLAGCDVELAQASYADLRNVLDRLGISAVDRVLLDLGLSSDQLADRTRGFSFAAEGPLDLRFDVSKGKPAGEIVQTASLDELVRLFRELGEEPNAERIARAIVNARSKRQFGTAQSLAGVVAEAAPDSGRSGTHPATRVFQALRIAVNGELGELRRMLEETLPRCLKRGGRAVIISFHSLEDRMVKQAFRGAELWQDLTPKPIPPTPSEVRMNPRARTAKLRAAVRN